MDGWMLGGARLSCLVTWVDSDKGEAGPLSETGNGHTLRSGFLGKKPVAKSHRVLNCVHRPDVLRRLGRWVQYLQY